MPLAIAPYHVMAKPAGGSCNLDCSYCFYVKKTALYPGPRRMSDEVLESYVRQTIESSPTRDVTFAWQGGEPTLMGVAFFERAMALQQRYGEGRRVSNALQTNGTLLDERWGAFLHAHRFLVGLSIDGPQRLHDSQRVDRCGEGSFDAVMRGLDVLKTHRVETNLLTVVSAKNAAHPEVVYRFLRKTGIRHFQFIPLVERAVPDAEDLDALPNESAVTSESVTPEAFGEFLCRVFDEWRRQDVGKIFVRDFEDMLGVWTGRPSTQCVRSQGCGRALALEQNGDVYACDHYVYRSHRWGNLLETPLAAIVDSVEAQQFGRDKSETLPRQCRECRWLGACYGGCPKHRFLNTSDGEPGLNYLCAGWYRFCEHIDPTLRRMRQALREGRPVVGRY